MNSLYKAICHWFVPPMDKVEIRRRYGLPETLNLSFRVTPDGWFAVSSPDLPGFVTQARSREELLAALNDAVLTYFDVPQRCGDVVYDQLNIGGEVVTFEGALRVSHA
jgi:predicted RNase H-like HicB family nuclease